MELRLPDQVIRGINMTEDEWMLDLAIVLYLDRRVSLGRGAEIARISKPAFIDALGQRRIPVSYDAADLESDLQTIANLRRTGTQPRE